MEAMWWQCSSHSEEEEMETEEEEMDIDSDTDTDEDEDDFVSKGLDYDITYSSFIQRIPCFTHTLQLLLESSINCSSLRVF